MTDGSDTGSLKGKTRLKLPDRFRVLKISENEYQLVSLYESMRARVDEAADQVLDLVFPKLQQGCELEEILNAIDASKHQVILGIIRDLSDRGLLFEDAAPTGRSDVSEQERDTYLEQAKFFSNFRPHFNAPPPAGHVDFADSSVLVQRKLKESRVMLVGLGRIGSRLAKGLAYVGVGRIYGSDPAQVTDDDMIDSGYGTSDAGAIREEALKNTIGQVNRFVAYAPLGIGSLFEQNSTALPDDLDLLVLCEDQFDPDHYIGINQLCLGRAITWTSCRNLGFRFEVGPMIVPRETACFKCLELRKVGNLSFYDDFLTTQRNLIAQNTSLGSLNITLGYEILALEVIKILTNFSRPMTYGSVFSFDLVTLEGKLHPVLKIPRCPECSSASRNRPTFSIWNPEELFEGP